MKEFDRRGWDIAKKELSDFLGKGRVSRDEIGITVRFDLAEVGQW